MKKILSEKRLTLLDKIVTNEAALVCGFALFALVQWTNAWGWVEPLISLVVVPVAGATAYEYWRLKNRQYSDVGAGEQVLVGIFINQPVAAALVEKFGRPADFLFSTMEHVGGRVFLTPDEMHGLSRAFVREVLKFQHREIVLVIAVPQAMAFQIGQLLGAHKFRVRPLNFQSGQFVELPIMGIDDMPG